MDEQQAKMIVGTIAGTPIDTQMGVDFLRQHGITAIGIPSAQTPEEQTNLQVLNADRLTEIVLAITPRVINNIRRPESELSEYWSGTELSINDRPQIVVPGTGGNGSGRNSAQRPSLPIEQPLPQEIIQDQPQSPANPSPAVTPPADSSSPTGGGQPPPSDPFRSPATIP